MIATLRKSATATRWLGPIGALAALAGCNLVADLGQFDNAISASADAATLSDDSSTPIDAGPGVPLDASPGVPLDASPDVSLDASPDISLDASPDVSLDASPGVPHDASPGTALDATAGPDVDTGTGSALDAGTDSTLDAAQDSTAAGESDAASAPDGAAEAGSWCALHAPATAFDCHDFDETSDASAGFTSHFIPASGEMAQVTSTDYAPGSPPNSLLIATPALDAGGYEIDQFNDVLLYHNKLEVTFALKIVGYVSTDGVVSLLRVSYQNNAWAETLDITANAAALNESWSNGGKAAHAVAMPTLNAWVNVDLLVDLNGHTQSLAFDGVGEISDGGISNPNESNPALFVQSGLNYLGGPAQPLSIYTDDIVVNNPP
ncbi:MAG: hypothetical protein ABTD50_15005 [Polyangiaceae bacterium]|jgi:hypothetical protein